MRTLNTLALSILLLAPIPSVRAATFVVTSTADAVDAVPGNGACATAAGTCTLRAALQEANALPGADFIDFGISTPATLDLTVGSLLATESVTINGPGSSQLTIDAGGAAGIANQVLVLAPPGANRETYVLSGLTITGGRLDGGARQGGGIHAGPDLAADIVDLTLSDVVVQANEVVRGGGTPALGGGLWMGRGNLTVSDCRFVSNVLSGNGNDFAGANVYVHDAVALFERTAISRGRMPEGVGVGLRVRAGSTQLVDCTIDDNDVTIGAGPASFGGGIAVGTGAGTAATLVARRTTISRNLSDQGGGIYLLTGSVTLENVTVSGNVVDCHGAGIRVDDGEAVILNNVTITGNVVQARRPGCFGNGGGIFTITGLVETSNTVIAGNLAFDGGLPPPSTYPNDVGSDTGSAAPNLVSLGHNVFGVIDPAQGGFATTTGDQSGVPGAPLDPGLQALLTDNGGFTLTHGPLAGSIVLEAGSQGGAPDCETDDQRLLPRPLDSDLDGTALCDVGAVETCVEPDSDFDFIGDDCDNCPAAPNTDQADADGDGEGDACDPCTDTDGDGFGDPGYPANTCPEDGCPDIPDPLQEDADGDGIGDACDPCTDTDGDGFGDPGYAATTCPLDNCPSVPNPTQQDTDRDGQGDACDTCTDTDGDGFGNPGFGNTTCPDDNCPSVSNPGQEDVDADGIGDACDTCIDSDRDGLGDPGVGNTTCPDDNCPSIANPTQSDWDGDFIGDACDPCTDLDTDGFGDPGFPASTCPEDNCPTTYNDLQEDRDVDGVGDACDICPDDPDPLQLDTDADLLGDGCDNCPMVPNTPQDDRDGDGRGDACDPCPEDVDDDSDGDGICMPDDNCPTTSNPGQEDGDSDGVGDACDNCRFDFNPGQEDDDSDGVGRTCDNCPAVANPLQEETDGDFIGDACDPCPLDARNDGDGDSVCEPDDNCEFVPNRGQEDADADGIGDACDPSCDIEPSALDRDPGATPLLVARAGVGDLAISWEDTPAALDDLYRGTIPAGVTMRAAVRRGTRPAVYDHGEIGQCGIGGAAAVVTGGATFGAGHHYYLAVSRCGARAGSFGRASDGTERPAGTPACP